MKLKYDLIIVGDTQEAIFAAFKAVNFQSRIALVLNTENTDNFRENWYYKLSCLGVDIIVGEGEFVTQPEPLFSVKNKKLKSRSYLIATGTKIDLPDIPNLSEIGCLNYHDIINNNYTQTMANLAIIGNNIQAIELSQKLRGLGHNINLVLGENRLLPYFDSQASFELQCYLEGDGIKVFTDAIWTQIKQIEQTKWLQVGDRVLEVDEVIFADKFQPNLKGLNLSSWGVKFNSNGFPLVNSKLQSTNPKIYFCGDVLGGYSQVNLGKYEADIAVKNALFFPVYSVSYNYLPVAVLTSPNLVQVGLTQEKAMDYYGDQVLVVCEYFKDILRAENRGFCKLVLLKDGTILGCVMVGDYASEVIGAIALGIAKNIKIFDLANFYYPSGGCSEIVNQVATSGKIKILKNNKILINLLKTWFNWRKK